MRLLFRGGTVVHVFTGELERTNVLIEDGKIIGVGSYTAEEADTVEDVTGKYLCPGFIDGHMHIESSRLTPYELAKTCIAHGTTAIVADPHEIANVCGVDGIRYMLEASCDLPLTVYFNIPSCVPASAFDESGAVLTAEDIEPFYSHPRVLGLAEMADYPGVVRGDETAFSKINGALSKGKTVDGHAPLLSGKDLDKYIAAGILNDHECTNISEAKEKVRKGLWIMIRQGTASRNLEALLPLFDEAFQRRCLFVTDDIDCAQLIHDGHIDNIIRTAVRHGKSVITAIRMATLQAAECFRIRDLGAIAPGYKANVLVLDDLDTVDVSDVYVAGEKVVSKKEPKPFQKPSISLRIDAKVRDTFHVKEFKERDFYIESRSERCRVIEVVPSTLITNEKICKINWNVNNGIDTERDILKIAVMERHKNTGHIGLGYIHGLGIKRGALASSVSHDSHNIIAVGTNDRDMTVAANYIRKNGGNVVVCDGEILAGFPLPIAGLMTDAPAEEVAERSERVHRAALALGANKNIAPCMNMEFLSLSAIPHLKLLTVGLIDVDRQEPVSLYVEE